ncbi:transposase [Enterococcus casseliflavus]|nr:transposase [Enterococcus casseliflavus]
MRLYPTGELEKKLWQSAGTARWVYNYTISMQRMNFRFGGSFLSDQTIRKHITRMKKRSKYQWLSLVSNNVAKQAVKDACCAYKKWFQTLDCSSELKVEIPKFKNKKRTRPTFYNDSKRVKVGYYTVFLEKIGWIKTCEQLPKNKKLYNPRISYDGKYWYLAVGIEVVTQEVKKCGVLGVYLNGHHPITLSNGVTFPSINETPKLKRKEMKLTRLQRQFQRKLKMKQGRGWNSENKNIKKLDRQIQLIFRKLSNIRENYWHQITSNILMNRPEIVIIAEAIDHQLAEPPKKILKERYYEFKRQLSYKCEIVGIEIIEVQQSYSIVAKCSHCGENLADISQDRKLFNCRNCSIKITKDVNTSKNLANCI